MIKTVAIIAALLPFLILLENWVFTNVAHMITAGSDASLAAGSLLISVWAVAHLIGVAFLYKRFFK
jgi:hypothetical protein